MGAVDGNRLRKHSQSDLRSSEESSVANNIGND